MNRLSYHLATAQQAELLRQASAHRLTGHGAATTKLIPPATRSHRSSRWTIRGVIATFRNGDRAPATPSIRGQA